MKYKLLIFDFDGTLADSLPWFLHAINEIAGKHGFKRICREDQEKLKGYDVGQILGHLGISPWKMPFIARELRAMMTADLQKIELFKGVDQVLKQLARQGSILAIVSSNSKVNIERVLGTKLMALFSWHECGVSIFGKAGKLRKILKGSGMPKAQAIFIGDEIRDAEAAKKAQIPFGAVAWGYSSVTALRSFSPVQLFMSVEEIAEKLA